jgi:pristinamycin I synthase-3/4
VPVERSGAPAGELASRPFDLGAEIPFRAHLLGAGDDHVLLLVIHHIAVDGWSVRPLAKDLGFAYAARLAGLAPPWRPLPVGYADYATWQRAVCASDFGSRQRQFWKSTLDGAPEFLALDTDRSRPRVLGLHGDRVAVSIGRALHRRIQDVAKRIGCTVFMVVHAALTVLMRQYGAGDDVVLGATVAGRADGLLDDLIGFFVNTLVLRVNLAGDPTSGEILQRVREADLAAMEHQEYPFDKVVELCNPSRSPAHNPVVQVLLAFQVGRPDAPRMPLLDTSVEILDLKVAKFDLTFELTECFDALGPDGITGHLEFATDLFDRATAARMVAELQRLLRIIVAAPDRHLAR